MATSPWNAATLSVWKESNTVLDVTIIYDLLKNNICLLNERKFKLLFENYHEKISENCFILLFYFQGAFVALDVIGYSQTSTLALIIYVLFFPMLQKTEVAGMHADQTVVTIINILMNLLYFFIFFAFRNRIQFPVTSR